MFKNILYISTNVVKFLLMFIFGYILFLFITHYFNLINFYDKKNIKDYSRLCSLISNSFEINKIQKGGKIIFVIDKFDYPNKDSWHGKMVLDTLKSDLKNYYSGLINHKDYVIIPLNLRNNFNESSIVINKETFIVNNYLLLREIRKKFPLLEIGVNQSFIYPNIISDMYLIKQFNDLNIFVSIAAGNFQGITDFSFNNIIESSAMRFFSFFKQVLFFVFLKDFFNHKYLKFNLNNLPDSKYNFINKNIDINLIYNSSNKSMDNNFMYFAKKYPEFFLLSNNMSTSGATPLGLNSLLFH